MNAYTNKDLLPTTSPIAGRKRPRNNNGETNTRIQKDEEPPFQIEWFSSDSFEQEGNDSAHLNARVTFSSRNDASNNNNNNNNTHRDNNNKLCLMGRAQLKCVKGMVEILGYRLDSSHAKVPVESPPWTSLLVFQPITEEGEEGENAVAILQVESWWPQDAENHLEPTFELVQSSSPGVRPTVIPSTWEHTMDLLLPQLYPENSQPAFLRDALEPLEDDNGNIDDNPKFRLAICGAKSVGKSTFLRYCTNRILHDTQNAIHRVAILDADVGQPEMSPPGMMTLTVVSEPFWTPPHYRSMASFPCEQQFSYFFGSVTSKNDPNRYIDMVKQLIHHYEQDIMMGENIPLLINLDGWVKGLGYELLTALLTDVLYPTHVVQIEGTTRSKQFPLREALNPEVSSAQLHVVYAYNSTLNIAIAPSQALNENTASMMNGETTGAEISAQVVVPISCSMPAQALRAQRLCTYFLNDVTIWYNLGFGHDGIGDDTCEIANRLAAALPYAVPFEAVGVAWEGSDHFADLCRRQPTSPHHSDLILDALNARIVGLCCRSQENKTNKTTTNSDDDDINGGPYPCIGLGLIRSIDRAKRLFYILTPVDSHRLNDVDLLVGGTIEAPLEFWFRGVQSEAFPYQTLAPPSAIVGADPMKSRNNIVRKSLNK